MVKVLITSAKKHLDANLDVKLKEGAEIKEFSSYEELFKYLKEKYDRWILEFYVEEEGEGKYDFEAMMYDDYIEW